MFLFFKPFGGVKQAVPIGRKKHPTKALLGHKNVTCSVATLVGNNISPKKKWHFWVDDFLVFSRLVGNVSSERSLCWRLLLLHQGTGLSCSGKNGGNDLSSPRNWCCPESIAKKQKKSVKGFLEEGFCFRMHFLVIFCNSFFWGSVLALWFGFCFFSWVLFSKAASGIWRPWKNICSPNGSNGRPL